MTEEKDEINLMQNNIKGITKIREVEIRISEALMTDKKTRGNEPNQNGKLRSGLTCTVLHILRSTREFRNRREEPI